IDLCQSVVLLVGRILYQRQQQERPFWVRWRDAALRECGRFLGARYIGRKLLVLALIVVSVFGVLAQGSYRVTGSATVQGVVQRALAAPFDGYIREALHRAGDVVTQNEPLAILDTREIELEL